MSTMRHWLAVTAMVTAWSTPVAGGEAGMGINLAAWVGQRVELEARPAVAIWQHLVGSVPGKLPEYVDLEGGLQIVAHVEGGLPCQGPMVLRGTVVEARGGPKRPGLPPSKADETWIEHALDVAEAVCVPADAELPALLERLSDARIEQDAKQAIEEQLIASGLAAVPLLLDHLDDQKEVWGPDAAKPSEAPGAAVSSRPAPRATLGHRCHSMLARLVAPRNYRSPAQRGATVVPPEESVKLFDVADWRGFFQRRSGQPLATIRAELSGVLDAFFTSDGMVQQVR